MSFSFINKPFFQGSIFFGLDMKNKMRPFKFNKIQQDGFIPVNPRLFKKFLFAKENKFIAFSSQANHEELSSIMEMLRDLQYDKNKIIKLTFCKSCMDEQKFTILDKSIQIKSFKNQIICSDCALDIVIREGKLSGLISEDRVSPQLKNLFNHIILKFKNIEKALSAFKPDFNPVFNKEITLYDIEENPLLSKKYLNYKVKGIDIPISFKEILKNQNISTLLPIQAISIEKGLLTENKNQLIMAPTSGGKTLIGELAGISKILDNKTLKMLYLVPIVALANIRTEEFKQKYKSLNLKITKRVGESLLDREIEDNLDELIDSNIIVATYEAIDYILRSGNKEKLGIISTIIIDEIQTLIDPDRGYLLDGFIARLKSIYKNAQFLFLSATLGEPATLANKLNCILIQYNNRPVPIERHLLLCLNEQIKHKHISSLVRAAFRKKSKFGYKGQSIIFTNTRKKCESLTTYLSNKDISVRAYHSGLTNEERKLIELDFQNQTIAGVVATAALAAGVDLPASQVIFESLAMGINWLTVAEFEQMLGRAGRLKKHEKGFAYLLVEPGKIYSPKMKITEDNIAINLLNGKIKDYELEPNEDKSLTELLAFISMFNQGIDMEAIFEFGNSLINQEYDINRFLKKLNSSNLIRIKENLRHKVRRLGRAISKSFLTIEQSLEIMDKIRQKTVNTIIDLALELKPLKNVYLTKTIVTDLAKNVNLKYLSNNLFSASILSLMNAENIKKRKKFSREFIDFITKWINDIFNCNCKDNPYCNCGRLNLEKLLFDLRVDKGLSIEQISQYFKEYYKILIFKGDIIDYLENLIYSFESIKNISEGISNLEQKYKEQISEIPKVIQKIKD
ncbi:MAG: DEAD/DEAH box helicase [Candidatus Thorarchaeota archaeon]